MTGTLQITKQKCRGRFGAIDTCAVALSRQGQSGLWGSNPRYLAWEASVSPHPARGTEHRGFLAYKLKIARVWNLASVGLLDGFTDFILSRQTMNCTPSTLQFYRFTVGLSWHRLKAKALQIRNKGINQTRGIVRPSCRD
jgi:hypothetical protein